MWRSKSATRMGEQSFQSSHILTKANPIRGNDKAETTIRLNVHPEILTASSFKGKITVCCGSHFPKSDTFGKCDPYCIVSSN